MDRDAARASPLVFAATRNMTTPAPVPEAPLTMVSQLSLLVALHAQPLDVFTVTFPVPPVASNDGPDPESEMAHPSPWGTVGTLDTETQGGADPPPIRAPIRTQGVTST